MKTDMTIDIVIPSYNQEKYLPDAIESAIGQASVIVVDDGSTDSSREIAERYPVKLIKQVNKGLASARNTGIMNSNADYVFFLDADDILLDNCIKRVKEVIKETNADMVAPSFKEMGLSQYPVILKQSPTLEDFKKGNHCGYCSAMRRDVLLEVGGYSPRMNWGFEDYHLWIDLLSRGKKLVTIPEVLWLYRVKENSMIHTANEHANELMAQIYKDFPNFK